MFERISSRIVEITPKKCEEILAFNKFEGQRPLDQDAVEKYATEMVAGTWLRSDIAMADTAGGERFLMNGQHQCHAGIRSRRTFVVAFDQYHCASNTDLWHLFARFDGHRQRSQRNVFKAARGLFRSEALRALPINFLQTAGSALLFLGGSGMKPNFATVALSKTERPDLVEKFEADTLRIGRYAAESSKLTIPVVAAMIATFRANEGKAREFWDRVLVGDNLTKGSPQWHLNRAIHGDVSWTHKQIGTNGRDRSAILYSMCVSWWNAHIRGENRTRLSVSSLKTIPEVAGVNLSRSSLNAAGIGSRPAQSEMFAA